MPLVINTNVSALNSQRQMMASGRELDQAMERLSSGKRINTAADDAAGLSISNRMTSQIRGLGQAIRNANDGVSMIQTAEGALDESTNILQRMRELAIQSVNGIYSDADRSTLDAEVQQLKAELDRIADSTSFNGQVLLDGSLDNVALQVGSEAGDTIVLNISAMDTDGLGGQSNGDVIGTEVANGIADLTAITAAAAATTLSINQQSVGDLSGAGSVEDALATINANVSGVDTSAFVELTTTAAGNGIVRGANEVIITLTMQDGSTNVLEVRDTGSLEEFVDRVNALGGPSLEASIDDDGFLVLQSDSAASIGITETGAGTALSATGIATGTTQNFQLSFDITDPDVDNVDLTIGATLNDGDLGLNNRNASDITGIAITTATALGLAEGDIQINGVDLGQITGGASVDLNGAALEAAINLLSPEHGVVATYDVAADTLTLNSISGDEIQIIQTPAVALADTGLVNTNTSITQGDSVSNIEISTIAGAQSSLDTIDVALEQINAIRADLGAINNRLDFTMSNLANVVENTEASRSRIMDADFAAETSALSRAQILQQASQAMLAQANASPQQVLQLLQG